MQELLDNKALINDMLARYGVRFGIYKNGNFKEQLFPFDAIPRVIPADQFATIEKGLIQRVKALNYFLQDVYGEKKIIKDGMVDDNSRNSCVIGTYQLSILMKEMSPCRSWHLRTVSSSLPTMNRWYWKTRWCLR